MPHMVSIWTFSSIFLCFFTCLIGFDLIFFGGCFFCILGGDSTFLIPYALFWSFWIFLKIVIWLVIGILISLNIWRSISEEWNGGKRKFTHKNFHFLESIWDECINILKLINLPQKLINLNKVFIFLINSHLLLNLLHLFPW